MKTLEQLNETQPKAIEAHLQEKVLVYHVALPGEKDCSVCTTDLRSLLVAIIEDMQKRYSNAKQQQANQMLVLRAFNLVAGDDLKVQVNNGTDDCYWIRCEELTTIQYLTKIPLPDKSVDAAKTEIVDSIIQYIQNLEDENKRLNSENRG